LPAGAPPRRGARCSAEGSRQLSRPAPSSGARPRPRRSRMDQRLQGHQRGQRGEVADRVSRQHPHHHGRTREGRSLRAVAGADARAREDDLHDRRRRSCDRLRAVRCGGDRALWCARNRCVPSAQARPAWGRGAALARLRLLRSVPQLRGPGRSVQGPRAGALVSASAVAGARVARQRAEQLRPVLRYDPVLLAAVLLLLAFGVVMVYRASAVYAGARLGDPLWFLKRQAVAAVVGLVALLGAMKLGYRRLEALVVPLVFVSLALLLCVHVPGLGHSAGGATRWLRIGPLTCQPSE